MLKIKKVWGERFFTASFYLIFFATPLIFEFKTRELFEFPKMIFIYFFAAILTYGYFLFRGGALPKPPALLKPFLILLGSQSLSTLFSSHLYTSVWGYYGRFNSGLISYISFFLIFLVLSQVINYYRKKVVIMGLLSGGLLVSFYAILQNFGLEKDFWVQDSQARAFSSLGQPNWLSAYLLMLLPLSLYFYLEAKTALSKTGYFLLTLIIYFGFWTTYSLSGFLGFIFICLLMATFSGSFLNSKKTRVAVILGSFLLISILRPGIFGAKIESFFKTLKPKISLRIESQILAATKDKQPDPKVAPGQSQKGIDTGDIRLVVWQGALDLWRSTYKNFLIGAGPETFAYNFLPFRPKELNQTTEWDFLYNKAHNYYLDVVTGSGFLGLAAFLFFSFTVVKTWRGQKFRPGRDLEVRGSRVNDFLFYGWAGTFVTNFFGWPTVILSLLFFTFPILMEGDQEAEGGNPETFSDRKLSRTVMVLSLVPFSLILWLVTNIFLADVSFSQGQARLRQGNPNEAAVAFKEAVSLNFWEPAYHKELSYALAQKAVLGQRQRNSTEEEAGREAEVAYKLNPHNSLTLKSIVRNYYLLANLDPKYKGVLKNLAGQIVSLSPTDPQGYYEAALIYSYLEDPKTSLKLTRKALDLKSDYPEAQELLQKLEKNKGN